MGSRERTADRDRSTCQNGRHTGIRSIVAVSVNITDCVVVNNNTGKDRILAAFYKISKFFNTSLLNNYLTIIINK